MSTGGSSINADFARPNLAGQRYVWGLAQAYNRLQVYDTADDASIDDDLIWKKLRRDAVFASAIENRRKDVASKDWSFEPASEEPQDKLAAQIMEELAQRIHHFYRSRFALTEGIFRGSSYAAIVGDFEQTTLPGDEKGRRWWFCTHLPHVDRWRFRLAPDYTSDAGATSVRWELWSVEREEWEPLEHPEHFICTFYERTESDLGYGRGLMQSLYAWLRCKEVVLAQGLAGVERWAQGMVTAKIGSADMGTPGDTTNEEVRDAFIDELGKMRSEHVIAHSESDEIVIHWPSGSGHQMIEGFLQYLDQGVLRLVQASDLTTGQGDSGTGSYAQATEQGDQQAEYYASDRMLLAEDIDYGLGRMLWKMNRQPIGQLLAERGLPEARRPRFVLREREAANPEVDMQRVTTALGAGVPLVASEVYELLGFRQPGPEDETIGGQQQMPGMEQGGGAPPMGIPGMEAPGGAPPPGSFQGQLTSTAPEAAEGARQARLEAGWKNVNGSPMKIGDDGTIEQGCPGVKGRNIDDLEENTPESKAEDKAFKEVQEKAEDVGIQGEDVSGEGGIAEVEAKIDEAEGAGGVDPALVNELAAVGPLLSTYDDAMLGELLEDVNNLDYAAEKALTKQLYAEHGVAWPKLKKEIQAAAEAAAPPEEPVVAPEIASFIDSYNQVMAESDGSMAGDLLDELEGMDDEAKDALHTAFEEDAGISLDQAKSDLDAEWEQFKLEQGPGVPGPEEEPEVDPLEQWTNPDVTASFGKDPEQWAAIVAGGGALNGVPFTQAEEPDWASIEDVDVGEPEALLDVPGKKPAAGVIIREPDGRYWIVEPTNHYAGVEHTFPKGKQEEGLSLQQTALKELFEEAGLTANITGWAGDIEKSTSVARYFIAERTGGNPSQAHWESQDIKLATQADLEQLLNVETDKNIAAQAAEKLDIMAGLDEEATPGAEFDDALAAATDELVGAKPGEPANFSPTANLGGAGKADTDVEPWTAQTVTPEMHADLAKRPTSQLWNKGENAASDALYTFETGGQTYVAMIQRKDGQWALPGGFVDEGEDSKTAALREAAEELGLSDYSLKKLTNQSEYMHIGKYNDPLRDPRSGYDAEGDLRYVSTSAHHFHATGSKLPTIKGSDDAQDAQWVPLEKAQAQLQDSGKDGKAFGRHDELFADMKAKAFPDPWPEQQSGAPSSVELPDGSKLEMVSGAQGSNPGGKFKGEDGSEHYVKFPKSVGQVGAEMVGAGIAEAMGLPAKDYQAFQTGSNVAISSAWIDGLKQTNLAKHDQDEVAAHFAHAALTGNWDVVGLTGDNLTLAPDGKLLCNDYGGSLLWRAQGAKKPGGFPSGLPEELKTLKGMGQAVSGPTKDAFGKLDDMKIASAIDKSFAGITDQVIDQLVKEGNFPKEQRAQLSAALKSRRDAMVGWANGQLASQKLQAAVEKFGPTIADAAKHWPSLKGATTATSKAYTQDHGVSWEHTALTKATANAGAGLKKAIGPEGVAALTEMSSSWKGGSQKTWHGAFANVMKEAGYDTSLATDYGQEQAKSSYAKPTTKAAAALRHWGKAIEAGEGAKGIVSRGMYADKSAAEAVMAMVQSGIYASDTPLGASNNPGWSGFNASPKGTYAKGSTWKPGGEYKVTGSVPVTVFSNTDAGLPIATGLGGGYTSEKEVLTLPGHFPIVNSVVKLGPGNVVQGIELHVDHRLGSEMSGVTKKVMGIGEGGAKPAEKPAKKAGESNVKGLSDAATAGGKKYAASAVAHSLKKMSKADTIATANELGAPKFKTKKAASEWLTDHFAKITEKWYA